MLDKLPDFGDFLVGVAVAALTGALVLWGTVSANRADIASLKNEVGIIRDDTHYTRIRIDAIADILVVRSPPHSQPEEAPEDDPRD